MPHYEICCVLKVRIWEWWDYFLPDMRGLPIPDFTRYAWPADSRFPISALGTPVCPSVETNWTTNANAISKYSRVRLEHNFRSFSKISTGVFWFVTFVHGHNITLITGTLITLITIYSWEKKETSLARGVTIIRCRRCCFVSVGINMDNNGREKHSWANKISVW